MIDFLRPGDEVRVKANKERGTVVHVSYDGTPVPVILVRLRSGYEVRFNEDQLEHIETSNAV